MFLCCNTKWTEMSTNNCSQSSCWAWDMWTASCSGASPLAVLMVDRTQSCPQLWVPGSHVLPEASIYYEVNPVHVLLLSVSQKSKNVLNRSLYINSFSSPHNIWSRLCQDFSFRFWHQNSLDSRTIFPIMASGYIECSDPFQDMKQWYTAYLRWLVLSLKFSCIFKREY